MIELVIIFSAQVTTSWTDEKINAARGVTENKQSH